MGNLAKRNCSLSSFFLSRACTKSQISTWMSHGVSLGRWKSLHQGDHSRERVNIKGAAYGLMLWQLVIISKKGGGGGGVEFITNVASETL